MQAVLATSLHRMRWMRGLPASRRLGRDLQRVRTLVRNARRERDAGAPPRSYRALFRELQQIVKGE